MPDSLSRSEAVRKYFTKTPIKPDEPDYSGHQIKMIIGSGLLSLALILLFSGSGVNILLGIALGYFGSKLFVNGFSAYSKRRRKYEEDCKQYEKDYEMAEPKSSDEQMDKWLKDEIEKIISESLRAPRKIRVLRGQTSETHCGIRSGWGPRRGRSQFFVAPGC